MALVRCMVGSELISRLGFPFNHCMLYLGSHRVVSVENVARLSIVTNSYHDYSHYDSYHLLDS